MLQENGTMLVRRPRGRPRKESAANDEETRRARGRRAQQDFHRRKQAMFASLESHVKLLEDTIESMSTEFLTFADRLLLSAEISAKSPLLQDLRNTMHRFLNLTRQLEVDSPLGKEQLGEPSLTPTEEESDAKTQSPEEVLDAPGIALSNFVASSFISASMSSSMMIPSTAPSSGLTFLSDLELNSSDLNESQDLILSSPTPSSSIPNPTINAFIPSFQAGLPDLRFHTMRKEAIEHQNTSPGRFSPQLTHGLLGFSSQSLATEIVSASFTRYMIGKGNSFPTHLYMTSLLMSFEALRGDVFIPGFITSSFRYRLNREPPHLMMFMILSQLEKMRIEYREVENEEGLNTEAETVAADVFTQQQLDILRTEMWNYIGDFIQDGGSIHDWIDAWSVYTYLRERWGLRLSSTVVMIPDQLLQRRARYHGIQNQRVSFQDQAHFTLGGIKEFTRRLVLDSLCLGDGPRFTKTKIDEAVMWLLDQHLDMS